MAWWAIPMAAAAAYEILTATGGRTMRPMKPGWRLVRMRIYKRSLRSKDLSGEWKMHVVRVFRPQQLWVSAVHLRPPCIS